MELPPTDLEPGLRQRPREAFRWHTAGVRPDGERRLAGESVGGRGELRLRNDAFELGDRPGRDPGPDGDGAGVVAARPFGRVRGELPEHRVHEAALALAGQPDGLA